MNPPVDENAEVEEKEVDPEELQREVTQLRLKYLLDQLQNDPNQKARFEGLVSRKVVRMQTFLKCVFYFLEVSREDICELNTQNLFWKIARHHWNANLIKKMTEYQFTGPKSNPMM